eukprot:scaffold14788_cov127-Isochrysis_galbana.AAC.1
MADQAKLSSCLAQTVNPDAGARKQGGSTRLAPTAPPRRARTRHARRPHRRTVRRDCYHPPPFAAEAELEQFKRTPSAAISVLHLLTAETLPAHVRQAGAVYFKNMCKQHWDAEASDIPIGEPVKQQVGAGVGAGAFRRPRRTCPPPPAAQHARPFSARAPFHK